MVKKKSFSLTTHSMMISQNNFINCNFCDFLYICVVSMYIVHISNSNTQLGLYYIQLDYIPFTRIYVFIVVLSLPWVCFGLAAELCATYKWWFTGALKTSTIHVEC